MKRLIVVAVLVIAGAGCSSSTSCTKVTIPQLTIKCTSGATPCTDGPYSSGGANYYSLGAYIISGSTCSASTMKAALSAASTGDTLSDASNLSAGTYSVTLGTSTVGFIDSKGSSVTQLCSGTYTVCAYYGLVSGGALSATSYQKLGSFNLSSPSTTTIGPSGWSAL